MEKTIEACMWCGSLTSVSCTSDAPPECYRCAEYGTKTPPARPLPEIADMPVDVPPQP